MQLEGIDHVAMGVRDVERSAKWYSEVLGFERLHEGVWGGVPTFVGKGNTGIALFPASQEAKPSAISHSIYFRDPDGHQLEITTYELEN